MVDLSLPAVWACSFIFLSHSTKTQNEWGSWDDWSLPVTQWAVVSRVPALLALLALPGGALSWSLQHSLVRVSIPVAVRASPLSSPWQEPHSCQPERDYSGPPFSGRETGAVGTAQEIVPSRVPRAGDLGLGCVSSRVTGSDMGASHPGRF